MMAGKITEQDKLRIAYLLLEYRHTGTFRNLHELVSVINYLLQAFNCQGYYTASRIDKLKSKYHLLFNLSNAGSFIGNYMRLQDELKQVFESNG